MIYDSVDLVLTGDGDLAEFDGDLADTADDPLIGIMQIVQMRARYKAGDWRLRPSLGVLEHPVGRPNTRENGELWEDLLLAAYTQDGVILEDDLRVEAVPVTDDTWLTLVDLEAEPSEANQFRNGVSTFLFWDVGRKHFWYY